MPLKISCIIPTYNNSADQIKNALFSVLSSSYPLKEVVLVDDGSSHHLARSIAEDFSSRYSASIVFHRQANKGASAARNKGVELSNSDWLVFLDADDIFLVDGLHPKVKLLEDSRFVNASAIFGSFIWSHSARTQPFSSLGRPIRPDEVGVLGKAPGGLPSYLIRRDVFLEVGGLDESLKFNEDFDFILRVIHKGHHIYGVGDPGFIRKVNPQSLTRADAFSSLAGGRFFLKKAWREGLLSKGEVCRRFFLNVLSTTKSLLRLLLKRFL